MSSWNVGPEEKLIAFPCDKYPLDDDVVLYRGVSILAPASVVYRWLCQLRVAPYSYDWLDNLGRQSPRTLSPGLERLRVGQRFVHIFELVDFERDRQITLRQVRVPLCEAAVTYEVRPRSDYSRLVVKLVLNIAGPSPWRHVAAAFGPAADLVMMRRQLMNLKDLAEESAQAQAEASYGEASA